MRIATLPIAIITALALVAGAHAQTPSPTPVPRTPSLSITKVAHEAEVAPGALVAYTITVTNSGFGAAENVRLTDSLPRAIYWQVVSDEPCDIDVALGNQILRCGFGLGPRHLNDSQTSFINPEFKVTAWGVAGGCGETYQNTALLVSGLTVLAAGPAVIKVTPCPTPTPTTTPTPGTTSTPTQVPTVAPTSTPVVASPTPEPTVIQATPTPAARATPLPPKTGNSDSGVPVSENQGWPWGIVVFFAIAVAGIVALIHWRDTK